MTITAFILGALKITLLDLTLSGDNVGIIALATKNLPDKYAKRATFIGIAVAVSLIIFFASCITSIMAIQWLPIKLLGGLLLVKITWEFVFGQGKEEEEKSETKVTNMFWEAVFLIILADISMSLDNVLAIASAANGHIPLIIFGVALNIPIIAFGSQYVAKLMKKHAIVVYIGGAVLAHTSIKMIFEDPFVDRFLPIVTGPIGEIIPWALAVAVLGYGFYFIKTNKVIDMEEAV